VTLESTAGFVVGIAGGTASGKTTIAQAFAATVHATLLQHDRYYRNPPPTGPANFDHPDALETSLLIEHLAALREGVAIAAPVYDFTAHRRAEATDPVEPGGVLVVEGILVLADPELRARLDLAVFVDCPDDIRLLRRMLRDVAERGRTVDSVATQYLATVRPMHERFVAPSARHAGLRLDGLANVADSVARVVAALPGGA
jgi:uridine kinase